MSDSAIVNSYPPTNIHSVIIDEEFRTALPELGTEEKALLETHITRDGCREALITWNGILIDGHNRYEICTRRGIPYVTREMEFESREDVLIWIFQNQIGRRNLTDYARTEAALKLKETIAKKARDRQLSGVNLRENLPEGSGRARDEIGNIAGVSGKTVDKVEYLKQHAPEDLKQELRAGEVSINKAFTEVKEEEKRIIEPERKAQFNRTNDNIEWAKWSWNPVTGCKHNCPYCYAEDIANRFYKEKFEPTYRPERLSAPQNTPYPEKAETDIGKRNVFVCSMADLFGEWVPTEWINAVLESVTNSPKWNFLFLTKNPKRLLDFSFPKNAWVGTTVDRQFRVPIAEDVFKGVDAPVKFLSCEPMTEELTFADMSMFDWVIIGGNSGNHRTPPSQPEWPWVEKLFEMARRDGVKVYFKPNLTARPKEYPGVE